MANYDFYQHRNCEYFPCHAGADPDSFSCMFCYCPLYALGENCGGSFAYTAEGVKDCSGCLRPHKKENYGGICSDLQKVIALVQKKDRPCTKNDNT